jgi:hypothetical protein
VTAATEDMIALRAVELFSMKDLVN